MVLLIIGYVVFVEYSGAENTEAMKASEVGEKVYVKPSETEEAYANKIDMKKDLSEISRRIETKKKLVANPTSFFDKAAGATEPIDSTEVIEEEVVEEDLQTVPIEESRQKVVYVTREAETEEEEKSPVRKRKRFSSSQAASSTVSSESEGAKKIAEQFSAVVHREVKARTNDVVKLRTTKPVTIDGKQIPPGTFIDGIVRVDASRGRAYIDVVGFVVGTEYIERKMSAFSLNGGAGLEVNIDLSKEAGRSLVGDALTSQNKKLVIPGVNTGTATGAAQRKVEEPAANFPAGTKLYLR